MNPFLESLLSKEFILKYISQEDIFERYLGISVNFNKLQRSSLRKDPKPSVGFKRMIGGDIICRDFGDNKIKGDCFNIVSAIHNCSFSDTLKIIATDFNLLTLNFNKDKVTKIYKPQKLKDPVEREVVPIKIKSRAWTKQDISFWESFGITRETLDYFKVVPISHYWYNDEVRVCRSMSFAYYFAPFCYKIYSPLETQFRFINNSAEIQGWRQLPETGDLLVLAKSLKDVMVFYEHDVISCSMQAEGNMLPEKYFLNLDKRFKTIISNYDFDHTGIFSSGNLKRRYGIQRVMFSNGRLGTTNYGSKDISDMFKEQGESKVKEVINKIKNYEKNKF